MFVYAAEYKGLQLYKPHYFSSLSTFVHIFLCFPVFFPFSLNSVWFVYQCDQFSHRSHSPSCRTARLYAPNTSNQKCLFCLQSLEFYTKGQRKLLGCSSVVYLRCWLLKTIIYISAVSWSWQIHLQFKRFLWLSQNTEVNNVSVTFWKPQSHICIKPSHLHSVVSQQKPSEELNCKLPTDHNFSFCLSFIVKFCFA